MSYLKKTVTSILLASLLVSTFTGCGGTNTSAEIKGTKALTMEEISANKVQKLSSAEKESLVYSYISNTVNVDLSKLVVAQQSEINDINTLIKGINERLRGVSSSTKDDKAKTTQKDKNEPLPISDDFANYMLMKFANTAYKWEMSDVKIQGFDAATRLFFVDVTYKTNKERKEVIPDSLIAKGAPNETEMLKKRYEDYYDCLALQSESGSDTSKAEAYAIAKKNFEETWGTFDEVLESQQEYTFLERAGIFSDSVESQERKKAAEKSKTSSKTTDKGIGTVTYKSESKDTGSASMTFRMVMGYNYSLGAASNLSLKSLYLYDYTNDSADSQIKSLENDSEKLVGLEILDTLVNKSITSYNRCVDETNHIGLYSMFDDYESTDKYYVDYDRYTYHKLGSYQYKVLRRKGSEVDVLVTSQVKERAKGASMSQPTYRQRSIIKYRMGNDDKLHIMSVNTLDMKITGEPLSVIKNVTGVSDQLLFTEGSFTEENKKKVENKIKEFASIELTKSLNSDAFSKVVDLGISQTQLESLKTNIDSIDADEMISYIVTYNTKSNVYVQVVVREVYYGSDRGNDTLATIDLINRNGEWTIVSYNRTQNVEVKKTNLDDSTSFVHIKKDGNGVKDIKSAKVTVVDKNDGESKME